MNKLFLTLLLLTSNLLKGQIDFVSIPYNISNGVISDTGLYSSFKSATSTYFLYKINNPGIDTSTKLAPFRCANYTLMNFLAVNKDLFIIQTKECSPLAFTHYLSENEGQVFNKVLLPNGLNGGVSNFDKTGKIFYSGDPYSGKRYLYSYSLIIKKWDSVSHYPKIISSLKLKNNIGFIWELDTTTGEQKIGITSDGVKTYQILTNIDYSKPPFSKTQNGMLEKLVIVTDDYWLAQHTYDSSALNQITKVYYTTDRGSTWKVLFNTGVTSIVPASNSTVYISDQGGPTNDLYQVSDYGTKVCLTSFKGAISSMYFWNADRGLILAIDTPNKQPGIWRVTNGGGAPCSITGITETITKNGSLNLYPNPATNQVTVSNYFVPNKTRYIIYSILGKQVQQGVLQEKEASINLSSLASGLYFIKIGDSTVKFVKE